MIQIAPLIYARTYQCDFNTDFLVRPDDFLDSDVQWARERVLSATAEIDWLNGFRWVIAKNENKLIAGIVCFIKDLVKSAQLTDEELEKAQAYFTDDKGRRIYTFIGLSILSNGSEPISIDFSYRYLWNIFVKSVEPVWKAKTIDTNLKEYIDYIADETGNITKPNISYEEINNVKYYEQNLRIDKLLFDYYLQKAVNTNVNFCSNIEDINVLKRQKFSIVTTKQNNIERLREQNREQFNPEKMNNPSEQEATAEKSYSYKDNSKKKRLETTTKSNKFILTLGIVIIILVLVIILLK